MSTGKWKSKLEDNYYQAVPLTAEECMTLHGLTLEEARKRGYRVCERKENKMDKKEFYTIKEAAKLLGITDRTIYNWKNRGRIKLVDTTAPDNPNHMIRMLSAEDFERIKNGDVPVKPEPKEPVETVESEPKEPTADTQADSIWREIAEDLIKAKPDNLWVKLKAVIRAEDCNI